MVFELSDIDAMFGRICNYEESRFAEVCDRLAQRTLWGRHWLFETYSDYCRFEEIPTSQKAYDTHFKHLVRLTETEPNNFASYDYEFGHGHDDVDEVDCNLWPHWALAAVIGDGKHKSTPQTKEK